MLWLATTTAPSDAQLRAQAQKIVNQLSIDEQIGQLLLIGVAGPKLTLEMNHWVHDQGVGGVVLFAPNIYSSQQVQQLVNGLQQQARLPLLIATDQEGGVVTRLHQDMVVLPGNMSLGATCNRSLAYRAGLALGNDLRRLGINMNLAPVLDVIEHADNAVIGLRSFGSSPYWTAELGAAMAAGMREAGVIAVGKHFPGHGGSHVDSHVAMPVVDATWSHMRRINLPPFARSIASGMDALMTAHVAFPQLEHHALVPASLSATMVTDLLRKKMQFTGLVMTDSLEMQAIVGRQSAAEAAVAAVVAGADMIMVLFSEHDKIATMQALQQAVSKGIISRQRIAQSVENIVFLKLKYRCGQTASLPRRTLAQHHRDTLLTRAIADASITLVRQRHRLLPLRPKPDVLVLAPPGYLLTAAKAQGFATLSMPAWPTRAERHALSVQLHAKLAAVRVLVGVVENHYHMQWLQAAQARFPRLRMVLISLGSPYWLRYLPRASVFVVSYSNCHAAEQSTWQALMGKRRFRGRLPIARHLL